MFTLTVISAAKTMAGNAYWWYEEQQTGLGEFFLKELDNAFKKLENEPYLFAPITKKYRQIILRKFPFAVVFEIFEREVVVISVFHTSRNPRKKFRK